MNSRYSTLEEVIQDELFPPVDVALRSGRHIDREDGDWYAFITDAQNHLEALYRRYGCELVTQSDGYFYLLPNGTHLARRQLRSGEMLVGQTLALQYLDPSAIQSGGIISREQLLTRLVGIIGDKDLAKALEPRRRRFDNERIVHETIRKRVSESVRRLATLGFIDIVDQDHLRLRSPLLRFADPVRGLQDLAASLERLIARGEIEDQTLSADEEGFNAGDVDDSVEDDA